MSFNQGNSQNFSKEGPTNRPPISAIKNKSEIFLIPQITVRQSIPEFTQIRIKLSAPKLSRFREKLMFV